MFKTGTAVLTAIYALLFSSSLVAQTSNDKPEADPFYQATGDHNRTYWFGEAGKASGYRVYVPSKWKPDSQMPLVVILHGAGGDENSAFDRAPDAQKGLLVKLAEERGYVLVAINGFGGAYGNSLYLPKPRPGSAAGQAPAPTPGGAHPAGPPPNEKATDPLFVTSPRLNFKGADPAQNGLSEMDVTNVVARMVKEYNIDRARIYLMGNSMGSIGTFYLATKYPKAWRAIVPSDGPPDPEEFSYDRLGAKAVFIIGGDQDSIADPAIMKALQTGIQAQGIDARYYDVPGGAHTTAWYMALPKIFDFYDEIGRR